MSLVEEIDKINIEVSNLRKRQQQLTHELILNCNHEFITASKTNLGLYPWSCHEHVTCTHCGISVNGDGCGAFESSVVDLSQSLIISNPPQPSTRRLCLDTETAYALKYPRRFTVKRLAEILDSMPWTVEHVLSVDNKYYSILHAPYSTYDEWHTQVYNND